MTCHSHPLQRFSRFWKTLVPKQNWARIELENDLLEFEQRPNVWLCVAKYYKTCWCWQTKYLGRIKGIAHSKTRNNSKNTLRPFLTWEYIAWLALLLPYQFLICLHGKLGQHLVDLGKVIHSKSYKHLNKGANQSHLAGQKMDWFLIDLYIK